MSNTAEKVEQPCDTRVPCDAMELLIKPRDKALGGFSVRRLLPTAARKMVGPWIFFDHMGPAEFSPGSGVNVRPHPHIGLATVTYLFEGEMLHRDSVGSVQPILPGDINLMVAGRGIVHSERERPEIRDSLHRAHGLQLWLALPEAQEEIAPDFHHYEAARLPILEPGGTRVRLLMGSAFGATSPVRTLAETLYLEAAMAPGQSIRLPQTEERAVYVVGGAIEAAGQAVAEHEMAIFRPGADLTLTARKSSLIAVIGGERFKRRYIEWNFVSSRRARVEQAKADWRAGRFPLIPGDDEESIPFPGTRG